MKRNLLALALTAAFAAQAEVCTMFSKDSTCTFAGDTSGGQVIYSNPMNLSNIGSGVITPFLGTQANGVQFGVSTDSPLVNTLPLNDKRDNINTFTNTFTQNQLGVVTVGSTDYYQFFLDTNEPNSEAGKLISIDTIRIWDAKSALLQLLENTNITSIADVDVRFPSLIYALGPTNSLVLNDSLFSGSGLGYDLSMLVPVSTFQNVALDSRLIFGTGMGQVEATSGGFEEWAYLAGTGPIPVIPEPSTALLAGLGLAVIGLMRFRRRAD